MLRKISIFSILLILFASTMSYGQNDISGNQDSQNLEITENNIDIKESVIMDSEKNIIENQKIDEDSKDIELNESSKTESQRKYGFGFWLKLVIGLSLFIGVFCLIGCGGDGSEMAAGFINGIVGLFLLIWGISAWNFIYTLQFSSVGLLLLVVTACIFTPVSIFSKKKYIVLCSITVLLSIVAFIIIGIKMDEKWWLWKYILVALVFVVLSWIFSGLLYLHEKHMEQLRIEQSCISMARDIYLGKITPSNKDVFYSAHREFIDFYVDKMKKADYEACLQQKKIDRERILQEQKNVEEARNSENERSNLEKKVKSLSDNVLLFQNAVDQKEPVNLQLLKMIEDSLSIVKNSEMNLPSGLKDELNRNLQYCRAVFVDCKNLDGYTNSSKLRMETILNLFEDILSSK